MLNRSATMILVALLASTSPVAADELPSADVQREIYVPFEVLSVILEPQPRRVYVNRTEYESLLAQSRKTAAESAPLSAALLSAQYTATFEPGRALIAGTMMVDVLADGLQAVPLDLAGVGVRSATLDGQPATLGASDAGGTTLFVSGRGRHELLLEIVAPLETTAAQQALKLQLPSPPASQWNLVVPGNVEVRAGASLIERTFDEAAGVTRLLLSPSQGPIELVLSLNNRQRQFDRIVVARSVLVADVQAAYERFHATVSLDVVHGATDSFRWRVPEGFEIVSVRSPLLAKWVIETGGEGPVLEVRLREDSTGRSVAAISAQRTPGRTENWTLPKLEPLDVAAHSAVVGLLLEPRLEAQSLQPTGLAPIDRETIAAALPALENRTAQNRAPRLAAAYYAPQGEFALAAQLVRPPNKLVVSSNVLLTVSASNLEALGGFSVRSEVEPLQTISLVAPAGWQIAELKAADGTPLRYEEFAAENGASRIDITLPPGIAPGQEQRLNFRATSEPQGWLGDWETNNVSFPAFSIADATEVRGAIAVRGVDDLAVLPGELTGLTPLDQSELAAFGLGGVPTQLAYRFDTSDFAAALAVEHEKPLVTARTFSFLRIEPESLVAHYELIYEARNARVDRLALLLPANTPAAVTITSLDNLPLKKYTSEAAGENHRRWVVDLAEPRQGTIRLVVDFLQNVEEGTAGTRTLPLVEADGVAYQSGTVAIETSSDLDVQVEQHPRKLDVAELTDAQYQPGRRLLGVFGTIGQDTAVTVKVARRETRDLPPVLVERAELVSLVATSGISQTVARYSLRTKAPILEISLPKGSTLWAVAIDGDGAQPQRDGDRLLVNLPGKEQGALRDLQIVYETPMPAVGWIGNIDLAAPQLVLRADAKTVYEVPTADLHWHLHLPTGYQMTSSDGTVYPEEIPQSLRKISLELLDESLSMSGLTVFNAAQEAAAPATPPADTAAEESQQTVTLQAPTPSPEPMERDLSDRDQALPPLPAVVAPAPPLPGEPESQDVSITLIPPAGAAPPAAPEVVLDAPQQVFGKPQAPPAPQTRRSSGGKAWALEGLRSLKIELAAPLSKTAVTFRSLGLDPQLKARVQSVPRTHWLAAAVAVIVILAGLWRTFRPARDKPRLVLGVVIVAALLPQVTGLLNELGPVCDAAIIAALCLVPYYLFASFVRWMIPLLTVPPHPRVAQAVTAMLLVTVLLAPAVAQEPVAPRVISVEDLLPLLLPGGPVDVPEDAVIVPYDPGLADPSAAPRVLVPYDSFLKLKSQAEAAAHPAEKLPPAEYGLAGASYTVSLAGDEYLDFSGQLEIQSFVPRPISIPLQLGGGVLLSAELDGEAARLEVVAPQLPEPEHQAAQPAPFAVPPEAPQPLLVLHVDRAGRARLKFAIRTRITRDGGWRKAQVRLPLAPATGLEIVVPKAATEVRLAGAGERRNYETTRDGETLATVLSGNEPLSIEWRAVVNQGQVDASLAASSVAVFDVREDRLKLAWRVNLELRRDQRDRFELSIPAGWLLERVAGENVRSWQVRPRETAQQVEVTLLQAAKNSASMTLILSRPGSFGSADAANIETPVVTVAGAQTQQGRVTIRRSPLVELRTAAATGWQRVDLPADPAGELGLTDATGDSPLGVVAYEAHQFVTVPGRLTLTTQGAAPQVRAELETIVRLSERELTLEGRALLQIDGPPLHVVRLRIPGEIELENVEAVGPLDWIVTRDEGKQTVEVRLARGARGVLPIVFRGTQSVEAGAAVALPAVEIVGATGQQGFIVVQSDPAIDVRAEQLVNCEQATLAQVFGWLKPEQRTLARFVLAYRDANHAAQLVTTARAPQVSGITVSNVRVTPRAIEETVLIELRVEQAGIRELSFLLPGWMRDARISAPLLRRKTVTEVDEPERRVRVRLEFQDDVMGQVRILAEHDRQLQGDAQQVSVPVVETGRIDRRYFTLEAAGRDEVDIQPSGDLAPLVRQQQEWATLAALLGGSVGEAFVATGPAPQLTYRLKDRVAVETAQARIGFAESRLVVDAHGTYRAAQEYRVQNSTEAWLEVELPPGAQLWAAQVAGEPVKPGQVSGAARRVRIPLVKTAKGDADYPVVLKYGGHMPAPSALTQVEFPLPRTINIRVEQSQVRLRLPETHRWFGFGGTMFRENAEADLLAQKVAYGTRQLEEVAAVLGNSRATEYEKVRARYNFGNLKKEQAGFLEYVEGEIKPEEEELQRNLATNNLKQIEVEQQVAETLEEEQKTPTLDNRKKLNELFEQQSNKRAKNEVGRLNENFDQAGQEAAVEQFFQANWFADFGLVAEDEAQTQHEVWNYTLAKPVWDSKTKAETFFALPSLEAVNGAVDADHDQADDTFTFAGSEITNEAGQSEDERDVAARYADKLQQQDVGQEFLNLGRAGQEGDRSGGGQQDVGGGSPQSRVNQTMQPPADVAAGLVSLDVALPERGREYLFTTPLGDTRITAWAGDASLARRLVNVAWMLAAIAVGVWLTKRVRAAGIDNLTRGGVIAALLLIGIAMLCTGLLPIIGMLLIVAALLLLAFRLAGGARSFWAAT